MANWRSCLVGKSTDQTERSVTCTARKFQYGKIDVVDGSDQEKSKLKQFWKEGIMRLPERWKKVMEQNAGNVGRETYDKRRSGTKYRDSTKEARNYAKLPNITKEHAKAAAVPSESQHRTPHHLLGVPNIQVFSCVVGSTRP
ncbi:hypothetical protein WN51_13178 [Melipona quadrifasciata]|uniref:Uncharacterized protein n=1 Tax=Melipona quadrifasciata TaxID=166423 RepID=A0A0M9A2S6_9HYME|nr:hypothetical protein WN51_13178 [Melipona quadrifasciata]